MLNKHLKMWTHVFFFLCESSKAEQDSGGSESKVREFTCPVTAALSQVWRTKTSHPSWDTTQLQPVQGRNWCSRLYLIYLHLSVWKVNIPSVPLEQNLESKAEKRSRTKGKTNIVERTWVQVLEMTRNWSHWNTFFVLKCINKRAEFFFKGQMLDLPPGNKLFYLPTL